MVDDVWVYDAPWLKATAPRQNSQPEFRAIEELRSRQYDACIIFTVYSQNPLPSAFMAYMADIPLRLAHCREKSLPAADSPHPRPRAGTDPPRSTAPARFGSQRRVSNV